MEHDGKNVLFPPVVGHTAAPAVFRANALDGWGPKQQAKYFSPAMIRTRRKVVMSLVGSS